MSTQLAEVYRTAAQVIRTNGHFKGWFYEPAPVAVPMEKCAVCASGALSMAVIGVPVPADNMPDLFHEAVAELADWVNPSPDVADPIEVVADWNDDHATDADEVIAALLDAAEAVSSRG